jgi:hypothetical protein
VIVAVGAGLVATPWLLSAQARRVAVERSPPMEAARSLQEGRLYGSLIKDVEGIRAELPNSAAATHLLADLHQDLGQIEYARVLYQRLIDEEPLNVAAHNNIGVYYLRRRETSQAIAHLEKATAIDESRLEPHRNLWSLYRDYLAFEEAEQVLARVRAVAPNGVANWFTEEGPASIVVMRDGYRRVPEIRSQLRAGWKPGSLESPASISIGRTVVVASFLVVAVAIAVLTTRSRGGSRMRPRSAPPPRAVAWVPGLRSLHEGRGGRAFLAVLVPVAVLLVPRMTTLGYRLPWGFNPGTATIWVLGAVLLLSYLALRWMWARSEAANVV